ncbi:MAG: hypothetical protein Q9M37_07265 [Desulfonauticus sp.]|nr:hypothetical protein [Desulfonauticus sp.]
MYSRYKITLYSPLLTPLYSDTIFGHVCWGIRYLRGEEFLQSFLASFEDNEPPMLISCAFPHGHLPRPVLAPLKRSLLYELALEVANRDERLRSKSEKEKLFWGSQYLKKLRKAKWISLQNWQSLRKSASQETFIRLKLEQFFLKEDKDFNVKQRKKERVRAHNSISRTSGRVLEPGGLYFVRETWYEKGSCLDVYVKFANQDYKALWDQVWQEYIVPTGFGKDKSTGAGQLTIEEDKEFAAKELFAVETYNAWMNLSLLGFQNMPKLKTYYTVFTRFGKLGGSFAVSAPDGGKPNPFKKPIILLEPGAVFISPSAPKGELLKQVHVDGRIGHYGLGLSVPLYVAGGE